MSMQLERKVHVLEDKVRDMQRDMDELLRLIAQNEKSTRRVLRAVQGLEARIARVESRVR